jgi:hypothetical protein
MNRIKVYLNIIVNITLQSINWYDKVKVYINCGLLLIRSGETKITLLKVRLFLVFFIAEKSIQFLFI